MLRFLADQNFDGDIVRGLLRSIPDLDVLTAHQASLSEAPDPELLKWAAGQERVVLTHDRRTMPDQTQRTEFAPAFECAELLWFRCGFLWPKPSARSN